MVLLSGQMVSKFGNYLYSIALPWYVFSLTNSKGDLVLTGLAETIPPIAGLFVGVWVDRWNKRRTMVISDLLRGGIAVILFILTRTVESLSYLLASTLILVVMLKLIGTVFSPAQSTLLPQLVPAEQLTQAMGVNQSIGSVAGLLGLFGGGTLLSILGAPLLFLFNGISFFVSSISLLFIRSREKGSSLRPRTSFLKEWREGIQVIFTLAGVLRVCLLGLIANFSLSAFDITMVAWVKGPMHGNGLVLGLLNGGFMTGSIVGGLLLNRVAKRISMSHILLFGCILLGLFDGSIALFTTQYWSLPLMCLSGATIGVVNGTIGSSAVQLIPQHLRGRIFSVLGSLSTLSQPLGIAVFGELMIYLPLTIVFVLIGSFVIIGGLLFIKPVTFVQTGNTV